MWLTAVCVGVWLWVCGCVYVCDVLLFLYYASMCQSRVIIVQFSLNLNFIIKDNIFTYLNISVTTETKLIY